MMPYLVGKTDFVAKGLLLRRYGVSYEAIAKVLGRDNDYWEFKTEALDVCPTYMPKSVNLDGRKPTHLAWKGFI